MLKITIIICFIIHSRHQATLHVKGKDVLLNLTRWTILYTSKDKVAKQHSLMIYIISLSTDSYAYNQR